MRRGSDKSVIARFLARLILTLILVAVVYLVAAPIAEIGGVKTPAPRPPVLGRLPQWRDADVSFRFHHTSQGTRILPLNWFMALEQPVATPLPVGRLAARDYLSRFGFLYETEASHAAALVNERTERPPIAAARDKDSILKEMRADVERYDLPIGFAIEKNFAAPYADPPISERTTVVGLTCAACHTGRIDVRLDDGNYKSVMIDGGSAMINISLFQDAVSRSLLFTQVLPMRFRRFARAIFGTDLPDDNPDVRKLREDLDTIIKVGLTTRNYAKEHKLNAVDGGFSRTDALGLIGNRVFGPVNLENQVVTDAPVNFPQLWDTAWFDWVQYNGSIRTPMARNIGEALGVGAAVNLKGDRPGFPQYSSTVNLAGLDWMEAALGGDEPFKGLQPPRWDEMVKAVFGKEPDQRSPYAINLSLAAEGQKLYHTICTRCHLPPRKELKEELEALEKGSANQKPKHFSEPDPISKKRFLRLNVVDLNIIGTDPNQALNFYRRVAVAGEPPSAYGSKKFEYWSRTVKQSDPKGALQATISAEDGLFRVTSLIRAIQYRSDAFQLLPGDKPFTAPIFANEDARRNARMEWDRYRSIPEPLDRGDMQAIIGGDGEDWVIKANLGYRARPHDGVWATAPFLHNSSVPNLYEMLLPAAARSPKFYLGSTRFDPRRVGYETYGFEGAFEMDTSLPGNSNAGHEFRDFTLEELEEGRPWDGKSSREERWAKVLGVDSLESLQRLSSEERSELVRAATQKALEDPARAPVKGVIGREFKDAERWQLVEYLKTL